MVFESIVADLLNKYLGEYVENLDRSQLQIGIWGGEFHSPVFCMFPVAMLPLSQLSLRKVVPSFTRHTVVSP